MFLKNFGGKNYPLTNSHIYVQQQAEDIASGKLPALVRKRVTVTFKVEYEAKEGEEVLLSIGNVEKKMRAEDKNTWVVERSIKKEKLPLEYRFVVASNKAKEEWVRTPVKSIVDSATSQVVVEEKI